MSYKITSNYRFPHGHAVAVCLPTIWRYMIGNMDKCIDVRGQVYLRNIFQQIANAMGANSPEDAISIFNKMLADMELIQPVDSVRVQSIEVLTKSVNPIRLKNNPVGLDVDTIRGLYEMIVK